MRRRYHNLFFLAFPFLILSLPLYSQVVLNTINGQYTQNFDSLASSGTTNPVTTLPLGWTFVESGTNANTTYAAGTGSSNAGNTYSFGLDASDRALGGLQSGTLVPTLGAGFTNHTGTIINSLRITYWGEQWRLGASGRGPDRLDFQYSLDATSLSNGTWTNVDSLDFSSPVSVGTVGALVGNNVHGQKIFTIDGLSIPAGATFFLRWLDFNVANADDGLGIDDFTIIPQGVPPNQPSISLSPSSLDFGNVIIDTSATLTYTVKGSNLEGPIAISVSDPHFTISRDGATFTQSLVLSDTGSVTIAVRFAPTADGTVTDSVVHQSGALKTGIALRGYGFDQVNHIIPIASARTQPVGTTVTVAGRVTVGPELGNPAWIQDATGGIPVFDAHVAHGVSIGDSIVVTGPIGMFSNQVEISGSGIFFIKPDSVPRFIVPKAIDINALAANEGLLVTVEGVQLVNKSFVFYPQSTERIVGDSTSTQADLRIDGDTNIPGLMKPQGIVNITGVVGRFNTNVQLLPRFMADIPGATLPTTPVDSIPKSKTLDVVNWNLEFFGARNEDYQNQEFGPADEALQLQNVRDVLRTLQPDIIAVEEISNDSTFAALVSQLPGYRSTCSARYSHSFDGPDPTFPPQKVCFIYDTTTVNVLSVRPLFESRYDSARTIDSSLLPGCPGGASSFFSSGRLPYWLTANVTINGFTEKISFAVIHAKSGATEDDRVRRLYDGAVLKDSLDAHYPGEKFIVLGDLNDDLDQSIVPGAASPYLNYVNDSARYVPITRALSDAGARSTVSFQDMIDHQILSNELREEYLPGSAQVITPFTMIPNYATTTSDHLPVMSRFAFTAPEVTFVNSQVTLTEDSASYVVRLALSKPLPQPKQLTITVGGTASYGVDYSTIPAASSGIITLALPAGATSASFNLKIVNDNLDEVTETALFTIQPVSGLAIGANAQFTMTLEDNDVPLVSFAEGFVKLAEGDDPYSIKLKLTSPPATDQSVTIQVLNGFKVSYGQDYTTSPEVTQNKIQVPIPAGSVDAEFTITALNDNKREPVPQSVVFVLSNASAGLTVHAPFAFAVAITDAKKVRHFVVHPNPTPGAIKITCDECDADEVANAVLRSINGNTVYLGSGTLDSISEAMSAKLKHERAGIYILSIQMGDQIFETSIVKI